MNNSNQFYIEIIKDVEKYINRTLNDNEEDDIIKFVKNKYSLLKSHNIEKNKLKMIIIETILEDLKIKHCSENIDIHEILKKTISNDNLSESNNININKNIKYNNNGININSIFGFNSIISLFNDYSKLVNVSEKKSEVHTYIILDSKYRFLDNDGSEYYKWGCINNYIRSKGTANHIGDIKDIKSIELSKFTLPDIKNINIFKYNRVSILIRELESQSFIGHEGRRFHFIAEPEYKNNKIEIEPHYFHNGVYEFDKPITNLDTITISLGNPLENIKFDKDRLDGKFIINNENDLILIKFNESHNINTGDYVYIKNFKQKNKIKNNNLNTVCENLINKINTKNGLQCYVSSDNTIYLFKSEYYYDINNSIDYSNYIIDNIDKFINRNLGLTL